MSLIHLRRFDFAFFFCALLTFFSFSVRIAAQNIKASNLSTELYLSLNQHPQNHYFHILVTLKSQVDLSAWGQNELRSSVSLDQQNEALIKALKGKAAATQPRILDWMQSSIGVEKNSVKGYWIANLISLKANAAFIADLSQHPEIDWIEIFPEMTIENYRSAPAPTTVAPGGVEPGLNVINARALWRLGYTGYGRKAMIVDSGQEYTHPALRTQFAYNYGSLASTYRSSIVGDLCGEHGTAVASVVLGLDRLTRDTIGVAFNALWIGAPSAFLDPNTGQLCPLEGIQTNNLEVLQWALNPDGNSSTSSDVPDVVNNSWGNTSSAEECRSGYRTVVQSLDAAGIAVVFSAGNSGPGASTVKLPGGLNLDLVVPMSIGSINGNNANYPISDFSSRGPTVCGRDGSFLIKPEVVAPGENVRAANLNGSYTQLYGTSFSAPYVTGAILLLKEAFPKLSGRQIALSLYNSARDLGPTGEDNDYGKGLIDVGAAYNWLIAQGFQPTPPVKASNDVIQIQAKPRIYGCDGKAYLEVTFENSGADTLRNLDIVIRREGQTAVLSQNRWTGKLAPGKNTSYFFPPFNAPLGRYVVEVELRNPNGFADLRSLNNQMKTYINVSSLPQLPDAAASAINICAGNEALVSSNYVGEGTVRWFNKNTGGTALGTGKTYATGVLTKDTVLFAELTYNKFTGLLDQTGREVVYNDSVGGIVFDSYYDFILKSVTIFPNRTGLRFFTLRNGNGQLQTTSYRVSKIGEQKVPLNFKVSPGSNHVLELTRGGELSIVKSNSTYPIVISDVLAIKGTNNSVGAEDYPYFFNWEIEYGYPCGRTPVFIDVSSSATSPQAQFSTSSSSIQINKTLNFNDLSINANEVHWDFGNGQSSSDRNPSTIYSTPGKYQVTLSATNLDGCSDVLVKTIQVDLVSSTQEQDELSYRLGIFPNPTQDLVNIEFNLDRTRTVRLSIVNAMGQTIRSEKLGERSSGVQQISMGQLPAGAYWLLFDVDGTRVAKPLRVIR